MTPRSGGTSRPWSPASCTPRASRRRPGSRPARTKKPPGTGWLRVPRASSPRSGPGGAPSPRLGLKPTQYRCAAESLLRRFRKEGGLPRLHPLVDLCNAVSLAFAIPVAVLDAAEVAWPLEVRYARGDEDYLTFGGETEHPAPGEVIFADQAGQAHARRWTNRQSGRSAVRDTTSTVLIVAEALHDDAAEDVPELIAVLSTVIGEAWQAKPQIAVLTAAEPRFGFG